jgi:hypothetical protein
VTSSQLLGICPRPDGVGAKSVSPTWSSEAGHPDTPSSAGPRAEPCQGSSSGRRLETLRWCERVKSRPVHRMGNASARPVGR